MEITICYRDAVKRCPEDVIADLVTEERLEDALARRSGYFPSHLAMLETCTQN